MAHHGVFRSSDRQTSPARKAVSQTGCEKVERLSSLLFLLLPRWRERDRQIVRKRYATVHVTCLHVHVSLLHTLVVLPGPRRGRRCAAPLGAAAATRLGLRVAGSVLVTAALASYLVASLEILALSFHVTHLVVP